MGSGSASTDEQTILSRTECSVIRAPIDFDPAVFGLTLADLTLAASDLDNNTNFQNFKFNLLSKDWHPASRLGRFQVPLMQQPRQ